MMVGGILLSSIGAVVASLGTMVYMASDNILCEPCMSNGYCPCEEKGGKTGGIALIIGGLLGVGAGIPLIVIGARKVPVIEEPAEAPAAALLLGPGGLTFRGQF
ncbi:uncharacterized protein CMC5_077300 [Chondromyces crocatus]|uniref:Transmembrane protein n=2 Tax=Chondromyces crocatus TaxID=52 RepID=A0A0K1ESA5_CHOCO|nr:uncharacterized protein CMC5_077300 [Chondromyces crocatus]